MTTFEIVSIIISIFTLLIGFFGVFWSIKEFSNSKNITKSQHINDLLQKIRNDRDVKKAIHMVDFNLFVYNSNFYTNEELEYIIDKTLSYFDYLVQISNAKILTDAEFNIFEYEIKRLVKNAQIKNYLYNIYHFSKKNNSILPFPSLINYCKKEKIILDDFFDVKSCENNLSIYKKVINI